MIRAAKRVFSKDFFSFIVVFANRLAALLSIAGNLIHTRSFVQNTN